MTADIIPPPEIIEFAKKAGYEWGIEFVREWNGFQVFFPNVQPCIAGDIGLPQYILLNDNKIRWADDRERQNLMYLDNKK